MADDLFDKAAAAWRAGDLMQAAALADDVLAAEPDHGDALMLKVNLAVADNDTAAALPHLERLAVVLPGDPHVLVNLGHGRLAAGDAAKAADAFDAALAAKPDDPRALDGLGTVRHREGRYADAAALHRRAAAADPGFAPAWCNLGIALTDLGDLTAADDAFARALAIDPGDPKSKFNRGIVKLSAGDYAAGWPLYEARLALRSDAPPAGKKWHGEGRNGDPVYLFPEQGYGDFIQMARFVPEVARRGGRPIVAVPRPLMELFASQDLDADLIAEDAPRPEAPYWCPMMSLPGVLGVRAETINGGTYVRAGAAAARSPGNLRVGIAWSGNPNNRRDRHRSLPPDRIAPLLAVSGVTFLSLQPGMTPPPGVATPDAPLNDFADTAAVITGLDLVISADTAALHLAGAMGKEVWGLLPFVADWRWGQAGERSPWYDSLRIFRQPQADDWAAVIEKVHAALEELAAG
ncbi:MAG: tetratricopeptide repeat protein [Rhodospirillaceae bacterium]